MTKIKKFCSKSCAAKYNNSGKIKNKMGKGLKYNPVIDKLSDEEIIEIFNKSNSIRDFSRKLGYKSASVCRGGHVLKRLKSIGIKLDELKNNPFISSLTKGELFDKYDMWTTARCAIQKRARNIYEKSDKPKKCVICGYDKYYEVAHIKPVSGFDDDALISEINDIDNLIALCPNHHLEYDNSGLDIMSFFDIYNIKNIQFG